VHPHGGIIVHPDGSTEAGVEPPEAVINPGTSLAAWYFETEGRENNPHAMQRYIAYLLAANQRFDEPREKRREAGEAEIEVQAKKREVNQQRDRVATAVAIQQREQNGQIVNHPNVVLFKPHRFGRIWVVVFGDQIVCQGVREDTCRHICRAGNDFLRSLPKQGLVDPITLISQFQSFLEYATAPESDWVPKLQTNLTIG